MTMQKIYTISVSLVSVFVLFLALLPGGASAEMSESTGKRLLAEYKSSCKTFNPSERNASRGTTVRCKVVRDALVKEAGCNFGKKKATTKQLSACANIISPPPADLEPGEIDIDPITGAGVDVDSTTAVDSIVNIVFSLAGGLALLFVAIGGTRYILSRGDPQAAAQARSTILYAIVGLIVTFMAFAIVRFVVSSIS